MLGWALIVVLIAAAVKIGVPAWLSADWPTVAGSLGLLFVAALGIRDRGRV